MIVVVGFESCVSYVEVVVVFDCLWSDDGFCGVCWIVLFVGIVVEKGLVGWCFGWYVVFCYC